MIMYDVSLHLDVDVLLLLRLVDLLLLLVDHGLEVVLVVLEQHALLLIEPLVLLLLAKLRKENAFQEIRKSGPVTFYIPNKDP